MPVSKKHGPVPYWQSDCGRAMVHVGDCREVLPRLAQEQFHATVTDPPYELVSDNPRDMFHVRAAVKDGGGVPNTGNWDSTRVAFDEHTWRSVFDACKPGAHLLAFGGARTFHRMACAIEDSGFEIRDTMMWLYASGYPKGLDVSKAIDAELGAAQLRPVVGSRVAPDTTKVRAGFTGRAHSGDDAGSKRHIDITAAATDEARRWSGWNTTLKPALEPVTVSRKPLRGGVARNILDHGCGGINIDGCRVDESWPNNLVRDNSEEVADLLAGAARFFFSAKANESDRLLGGETLHPTVKPLALMRYLVRLVCARGGTVLDPFMGSGSTGVAAVEEGMYFVGIEQCEEYAKIAVDRLKVALGIHPHLVKRLDTGRVVAVDSAPPTPRKLR